MISDDADQVYVWLTRLRDWLGDAFLGWVLGDGTPSLTPAQQEVVIVLYRSCSPSTGQLDLSAVDFLVSNRDRPGPRELLAKLNLGTAEFLVPRPPGFDAGHAGSILNALRVHAGGDLPVAPPPTADAVADSLRALAVEVYGSLLLPEGTARLSLPMMSTFVSAAERRVMDAIKADPGLPFNAGSSDGDRVSLMTSTGRARGVLLAFFGPSLVAHAWDLACLQEARPSAEALLDEIPVAVAAARAALTGTKTTATGLVSLGGVLLPAGSELSFAWGQLRPVRDGDHPRQMQDALAERRLTQHREDGERVVISDGGDIMLAAAVPFTVRAEEYDPVKGFPNLSGVRELETRILQVRLALVLAWPDPRPPVLLPFGERFIEPLTPVDGFSWHDLHHFAIRAPVQLSPEMASAWRTWIELIDAVPLRSLGEAPHRLLRATSERGQASDSLIDAVIAWESLVSTTPNTTLAVSKGIAKILRPPGEDRSRLQARVREIYGLRSDVVHGRDFDAQDVAQATQEACRLAADALRVLIADRPDLVPMTSAERSARILAE